MFGNKKVTWVLVADGSRAQIYTSYMNKHDLSIIHDLRSDSARTHSVDLGSKKSHGIFERNKPESKVNLQLREEEKFAHEVAELLNNGAYKNEFHALVLIASPKFLGILRLILNKYVSKIIIKEITKDLTHKNEEELKNYIWE